MSTILPNPLLPLHHELFPDLELQPYGDLEIPSTFGEPQAEYAAVNKSVALMDQPHRGHLELTGRDRHPFLNNLLTNQTYDKQTKTGLESGRGVYAFFLNTKGRVVADMNVIELADGRTLLETDARLVEPLRQSLDKYLFADQVKLTSRLADLHQFALHGPNSPNLLATLTGLPATAFLDLTPLASLPVTVLNAAGTIFRDDATGRPGFHLVLPAADAPRVWREVVQAYHLSAPPGNRPLRPIGWAAFNATRIEAGRPLYGVDFDDTILPAETSQLSRAVSFTKGCYLGQEIVARMHARNQVAKRLVGLKLDAGQLPFAGTQIFDGSQNAVGVVTSSTVSPLLAGAALCLGIVKSQHAAPGTTLHVPAEGAIRPAVVTELPFLPARTAG